MGASLNEIIDSFWFAAAHVQLRHVYIGLNLNVYNDYNASARAASFKAIDSQPALYFFDRNMLEAAYYDVLSAALHRDLRLGVPQMGREEFWKQQLGTLTDAYYSRYVRPTLYRRKLAEVSRYARDHKIALIFIIPPTHAGSRDLGRHSARRHQALAIMFAGRRFKSQLRIKTPFVNSANPAAPSHPPKFPNHRHQLHPRHADYHNQHDS